MSDTVKFAMLFPILAIITIAAFAGGLGVVFMLLNATELEVSSTITIEGEVLVIILGSAIVVGVPVVAYILERRVSKA